MTFLQVDGPFLQGDRFDVTVPGPVMPAPRMTRRDKWQRRPCVLKYRAWRDHARAAALKACWPPLPLAVLAVTVHVFIQLPPSMSKRRRLELEGQPCRVKPDFDNVAKTVADLFAEGQDQQVALGLVLKTWTATDPRTEISVWVKA